IYTKFETNVTYPKKSAPTSRPTSHLPFNSAPQSQPIRTSPASRYHLILTSFTSHPHRHLIHIRSLTLTLSHSYLRRSHHLIIFSKTSIVMHANREGGVLQHLFFKKSHKK